MNTDPFAGMGGSYKVNPDGSCELVERTGMTVSEPSPMPAQEPIQEPNAEPDKPKK